VNVPPVFLILLTVIAVAAIGAGAVLAISHYSSAGAFAVASACVGVLGTLAAEARANGGPWRGNDSGVVSPASRSPLSSPEVSDGTGPDSPGQ
jgi:hypothetical protein